MHTGTWTTYISTFAFHWLDTVTNHGTAKAWIANIVPAICNIYYTPRRINKINNQDNALASPEEMHYFNVCIKPHIGQKF